MNPPVHKRLSGIYALGWPPNNVFWDIFSSKCSRFFHQNNKKLFTKLILVIKFKWTYILNVHRYPLNVRIQTFQNLIFFPVAFNFFRGTCHHILALNQAVIFLLLLFATHPALNSEILLWKIITLVGIWILFVRFSCLVL